MLIHHVCQIDSPLVQLCDELLALLLTVQDPYDMYEYGLPHTQFELVKKIDDEKIVDVVSESQQQGRESVL
jgi:hypothetical protein